MKKLVCVTLAVFVLATCSLWAQTNLAGDQGAEKTAPSAFVKHILKGVYNSTSTAITIYPGGFFAVDAANNILCPGTPTSAKCLVQAAQWAQIGDNPTGAQVGICFAVDGVFVNGCYLNGDMPGSGKYTMFSVSQGITVAPGTHTVQTFISTGSTGYGFFYNFTYSVYKP
jgi:hypothetical protein